MKRLLRRVMLFLVPLSAACDCATVVQEEARAPDGALTAFVYRRDCGATVLDHRHIAILPTGRRPGDESPNVATIDGGNDAKVRLDVALEWNGPRQLTVSWDARARVIRKAETAEGVAVSLTPLEVDKRP